MLLRESQRSECVIKQSVLLYKASTWHLINSAAKLFSLLWRASLSSASPNLEILLAIYSHVWTDQIIRIILATLSWEWDGFNSESRFNDCQNVVNNEQNAEICMRLCHCLAIGLKVQVLAIILDFYCAPSSNRISCCAAWKLLPAKSWQTLTNRRHVKWVFLGPHGWKVFHFVI